LDRPFNHLFYARGVGREQHREDAEFIFQHPATTTIVLTEPLATIISGAFEPLASTAAPMPRGKCQERRDKPVALAVCEPFSFSWFACRICVEHHRASSGCLFVSQRNAEADLRKPDTDCTIRTPL
jgi:hypothetical protein